MAKLSVIDMVQDIMSDMNSDEVNDLNDTVESLQVAQIIQSTFFEIIDSKQHWPHLRTLGQLGGFSNSDLPSHMRVPENVREVEDIEYRSVGDDGKIVYKTLKYLEPDQFLRHIQNVNSTLPTTDTVIDPSGVELLIKNDRDPVYWTSFDDETIVMDAYNKDRGLSLVSSDTRVIMYRDPGFEMANDFVPDLPSEAFSYLLAEAKSTCFARLKQAADRKAEQQSRRQRTQLHRSGWRTRAQGFGPSGGRRSRK